MNTMDDKKKEAIAWVERLLSFIPGQSLHVADLPEQDLTASQQTKLTQYKHASYGIMGIVLAILIYPRVVTMLLGVIVGGVLLIYRKKMYRALYADIEAELRTAETQSPPQQ